MFGVQGRYFTVAMPLLFLALVGLKQPVPALSLWLKRIIIPTATLGLIAYIVGLWLSYHVPCGSQYYQPGLCYQPKYKNFSPTTYATPLSEEIRLIQEFIPECDGMTSIRIWVNTADDLTQHRLFFLLSDDDNLLVNEEVTAERLPRSGWYTFSFLPETKSSTKTYQFTLHGSGVDIATSIRPEYPQAKLYLDNELSGNDTIFQ
ncbi:MAG: hypothetical protein L3J16_05660 [Anaerolineales bacterium]|nr:hypothetical protein [Anaerolineales bacterium]